MKAIYISLLFLSTFTGAASAQWKKVSKLPVNDYYSLLYHNGNLYASGTNRVYISANEGVDWDSTNAIGNDLFSINDFIIYENEYYATSYGHGVFKSVDNGASWQNITLGIDLFINEFYTWKGKLFASTDDGGVYKLKNNRTGWEAFNNGFYWNTSSAISGNDVCLVAAGGANGAIFRYTETTGEWQDYFLKGTINPGLTVSDIIAVNDTLYAATNNGIFSSRNGIEWTNTGTVRNGNYVFLANVKQAVFAAVNHGLNEVSLFKKSKEHTPSTWVLTDQLQNMVVYEMLVTNKYLWHARNDGLYYRSLSDYNVTPPYPVIDNKFFIGKIFPNPAQQQIHIKVEVLNATKFSATITNAIGQKVSQPYTNATLHSGANTISIHNNLPSGLYYVTIMIDGKSYVRNFLSNYYR